MRNLNNLFIYTKKIILKYYIVKMGNEESSVEEIPGLQLLSQGAESLWSVILQQEEDEGKCLFIREPGSNTQTDLCRAGVEVNLGVITFFITWIEKTSGLFAKLFVIELNKPDLESFQLIWPLGMF